MMVLVRFPINMLGTDDLYLTTMDLKRKNKPNLIYNLSFKLVHNKLHERVWPDFCCGHRPPPSIFIWEEDINRYYKCSRR